MADILSKGSLFPEELIPGFIQKTTGASALAKLCGATPIAFNGQKEFTFTLDKEVDIVAENGAKGKGGMTVEPITIVPIKIEYGARVSDEFLYASEDAQMDVLSAFADGFAKKVAKGLDLMAFHGINPRTGSASGVIPGRDHCRLRQARHQRGGRHRPGAGRGAGRYRHGAGPQLQERSGGPDHYRRCQAVPAAGLGRKPRRGERPAGGIHLQPVRRFQPGPCAGGRLHQLLQVGLRQGDAH